MKHHFNPLFERIHTLEEKLFPHDLDPSDSTRMKSDRYSWHYRPSHHIESGLLTQEDITMLSLPGRRLLSIGAFPAFLERILPELGVPQENILIADKDPAITGVSLPSVSFDMLESWPDLRTFDLILFPESLCISLSNKVDQSIAHTEGLPKNSYPRDSLESTLLAGVLKQSLHALCDDGMIRANGPMSHPNVVRAASELLKQEGVMHAIRYQRYLITVEHAEQACTCEFA